MRAAYEWIRQGLPVYEKHHGFYLLPLVGIALVAARYLAWRRLSVVARGTLYAMLVVAALFSVLVYNNFFNYHYGGYVNAYEFFHYYLGSKYAREVGYFDLYRAALVADDETGRIYWPEDGRMTDLASYRLVPVTATLAEEAQVRSHFSDSRWNDFVDDVFYFKQHMAAAAWNRILRDHGYNATPAWTWLAGSLTNRVPTSSAGGMLALALLDALLLAVAVGCIGWAFGWWPALLALIFLASSYLMAHVHMKGAFLRTDFVVSLVVAICLLRRGRAALAGALVGYSTMTRLFPAIFLLGPAVRAVSDLVAARGALARIDRRYARFFGGFALCVALLFAGSVLQAGGLEPWVDFARKISVHRALEHPWNVGLPSLLPADSALGRAALRTIQLAAVVACVFAVRRLADHRALAFGFVPMFFLVSPTYYYYIVLLVPFVFLAEQIDRASGALGLTYMFLFGLAGHVFYQRWEQLPPTYYANSWLSLGLALYLLAIAWSESWRSA